MAKITNAKNKYKKIMIVVGNPGTGKSSCVGKVLN
jgi:KaiC/GvpD/RAD55 family RecA-like ATPase